MNITANTSSSSDRGPSLARAGIALIAVALLAAACGAPDAETAGEMPEAGAATEEAPAAEAAAPEGALVDPNTASETELAALPGMAPARVEAIMAGRPFADMLAVDAALAPSMDEAARESLYAHLWLPLDLNSASREEILLIPGVGDRMAGEFLEYRPYDGMARFRREIGKYVDDKEVARLERYLTIR